ncbi:MAG: 2-dehydropantoate 2-reductase [Candidatus Eisenbacteria bacterium]|nr:2-dehydropantoate 2-reductase [Candidatus Eisenbacteria bacterium]
MRVLVFGAGAVGALFGGCLSGPHRVLLVGRRERIDPIGRGGLFIRAVGGTRRFDPETAESPPREGDFDLAAIAVKAFDLEAALPALSAGGLRIRRILLLQNGLGNESLLRDSFPPESIYRGLLYHGASWEGPGRLLWHRGAPLRIGRPLVGAPSGGDPETEELARALTAGDWETLPAKDIRREIWRKLIVNAAINPLGAITGLPNGELIRTPALRHLLGALVEEGERTALAAAGYRFDLNAATMEAARQTAENRNSMLLDLERGRRTEIEFLCGALLRAAREKGIPTPAQEAVYGLVKAMEGEREGLPEP